MKCSRNRIDLSKLGEAAKQQLALQLGQKQFEKLCRVKKEGRYRVGDVDKRVVGDLTFDSKWERVVYQLLGDYYDIKDIGLQPVFELQPSFTDNSGKKHRPITYVGDFLLPGKQVVDAKGHKTEVFRMKQKMFLHKYRDHNLVLLVDQGNIVQNRQQIENKLHDFRRTVKENCSR
jgi:hypothetical protein